MAPVGIKKFETSPQKFIELGNDWVWAVRERKELHVRV